MNYHMVDVKRINERRCKVGDTIVGVFSVIVLLLILGGFIG